MMGETPETTGTAKCTVSVEVEFDREIEYDRKQYADSGLELHQFLAEMVHDGEVKIPIDLGDVEVQRIEIVGDIVEEVPAR